MVGLECPRCRQPGFEFGCIFHWCGDPTKQCGVCGKDWPMNTCPKCYKPGYVRGSFSYLAGRDCSGCGRPLSERVMTLSANPVQVQKIKLPYPYPEEGDTAFIEAWSEKPGCLLIRRSNAPPDPVTVETITVEETQQLLTRLGLQKENIPGWNKNCPDKPKKKKRERETDHDGLVEYVSKKEWDQFQRWKDSQRELEDLGDENLDRLKDLLRAVTMACPEFDEEMDDLIDGLRKMPRLMRYIKTGIFPGNEIDDDDLAYYDDSHSLHQNWTPSYNHNQHRHYEERARKPIKPRVVEVRIEDISDGKL